MKQRDVYFIQAILLIIASNGFDSDAATALLRLTALFLLVCAFGAKD